MLVLIVIAASAFLVAVLSLALFREVRLRRALETLLARILAMWRRRHDDSADRNFNDGRRERGPD